ncbi:hypothetical protein E2C01_014678 [Portunus trituberculatus]|uniref:Uncharacterized protein n=1 Tax=Portunus trituberculatus TaxID=210409 RepID=A0A5B7DKR0_PORTR|nr:hypothetical protein [Portunus trituberculatus]
MVPSTVAATASLMPTSATSPSPPISCPVVTAVLFIAPTPSCGPLFSVFSFKFFLKPSWEGAGWWRVDLSKVRPQPLVRSSQGTKPIKLLSQLCHRCPGSQATHPHPGGGHHFPIANLALKLANVLSRQLNFSTVRHVQVLKPHKGIGIPCARRRSLNVYVVHHSIAAKDPS